jgi:hypothetical protein
MKWVIFIFFPLLLIRYPSIGQLKYKFSHNAGDISFFGTSSVNKCLSKEDIVNIIRIWFSHSNILGDRYTTFEDPNNEFKDVYSTFYWSRVFENKFYDSKDYFYLSPFIVDSLEGDIVINTACQYLVPNNTGQPLLPDDTEKIIFTITFNIVDQSTDYEIHNFYYCYGNNSFLSYLNSANDIYIDYLTGFKQDSKVWKPETQEQIEHDKYILDLVNEIGNRVDSTLGSLFLIYCNHT